MNNDIVPQRRPQPHDTSQPASGEIIGVPVVSSIETQRTLPKLSQLPEIIEPDGAPQKPRKRRLKWIIVSIVVLLLLVITLVGAAAYQLGPRDPSATNRIPVEIVSGMVPSQIAETLTAKGVIRSPLAFLLYARISGTQDALLAGNYDLSPADSVPRIISQLQSGTEVDEIELTFKPGETLEDNKKELLSHGYKAGEIDAAFTAQYDHPLFASRPKTADLEGYIFGETHRFVVGTPVEEILNRYFDDYYQVITENNLSELYEKQGLSLFEGITLASIVQRESGGDDKEQIAQIFFLRLSRGIQLGSDVTYQYIADKEGNPREIDYNSPYNTRRYTGLPPGPIATPGVAALKAVGNPAAGDYLYFLSGDDDVTYYARTLEEHEANIRNHCQEKCQII